MPNKRIDGVGLDRSRKERFSLTDSSGGATRKSGSYLEHEQVTCFAPNFTGEQVVLCERVNENQEISNSPPLTTHSTETSRISAKADSS